MINHNSFQELTGCSFQWDHITQLIWKSASRRSATRRTRPRKAVAIPPQIIKRVLEDKVWQPMINNRNINLITLRAALMLIIQHRCAARWMDSLQLRTEDFHLQRHSDNQLYLRIEYKSSKTDRDFAGSYAFILANPTGDHCAVEIIRHYFARIGAHFGNSPQHESHTVFPQIRRIITNQGSQQVPEFTRVVSTTTLLEQFQTLVKSTGYRGKITTKSAKMSSVAHAHAAGFSQEELMLHGRWRSHETPRYYNSHLPAYKLRLAAKMHL